MACLPSQEAELLEQMQVFVSQIGNYGSYRHRLAESHGPTSPYVGMYLTDLTYINDGNPTFVPDRPELVNFTKAKLIGTILEQIISFQVNISPLFQSFLDLFRQQIPYLFFSIYAIRRMFILLEPRLGMDELYQLSLEREPR